VRLIAETPCAVLPALVAGIHAAKLVRRIRNEARDARPFSCQRGEVTAWMAVTSTAMTEHGSCLIVSY
jgi:hypothetical protein